MSTPHVIVVNGYPQSGKDTFVDACLRLHEYSNEQAVKLSSITPIIELTKRLGFNISQKTQKDRNLLAGLAQLVEDYNNYKTNYIKDIVLKYIETGTQFVYIFIREPSQIDIIKNFVNNYKAVKFYSVYIEKPENKPDIDDSNKADTQVTNYFYDFTIKNNSTIEDYSKVIDLWHSLVTNHFSQYNIFEKSITINAKTGAISSL